MNPPKPWSFWVVLGALVVVVVIAIVLNWPQKWY